LRQAISAERLELEPVWVAAEAAAELLEVVEVVLAALPQAASAALQSTAVKASEARRTQRGVACMWFMGFPFRDGW
jgi:hypothetical protein